MSSINAIIETAAKRATEREGINWESVTAGLGHANGHVVAARYGASGMLALIGEACEAPCSSDEDAMDAVYDHITAVCGQSAAWGVRGALEDISYYLRRGVDRPDERGDGAYDTVIAAWRAYA